MPQINASIVLYNNKREQLKKVIDSFLGTRLDVLLYLVDNSADDALKDLASLDSRIVYIFNNANVGYGAGHNVALKKSIDDGVAYHVVLNPDVYYERGVIEKLYTYMQENQDTANIMPQVFYPDGNIQYLCKLLPTPFDLIFRRFIPLREWVEKRNEKYELKFSGYNKKMNVPSLSGCFMFLRIDALKEVGLFDENIFMYLEDLDLNRRLHMKFKTIFYPKVSIVHEYAKESYKNKRLLSYHIKSAIYYFNKWGWFFDKDRNIINSNSLKELQKK